MRKPSGSLRRKRNACAFHRVWGRWGGRGSAEGNGLLHGWGLSGAQRKVLHNLPLPANLLHHNQVLSQMNDGANTPSRLPCLVGERSRTFLNTRLDCAQPASLIQSRFDPLPNLVPSFEGAAITHHQNNGLPGIPCWLRRASRRSRCGSQVGTSRKLAVERKG